MDVGLVRTMSKMQVFIRIFSSKWYEVVFVSFFRALEGTLDARMSIDVHI